MLRRSWIPTCCSWTSRYLGMNRLNCQAHWSVVGDLHHRSMTSSVPRASRWPWTTCEASGREEPRACVMRKVQEGRRHEPVPAAAA